MDLTNLNKDRKERRKTHSFDLGSLMYGKVPPQAKDLEEAILGAIMLEKDAFFVVQQILKPEMFYVEAHQRIFRAMAKLEAKSSPIDILTIVEELRNMEELELVGGPYYVSKLTNGVVSAANIESHSRIVFQKFMARLVIEKSSDLINTAYEDTSDPFDLVSDMMETNDLLTTTYLPKDVPYESVVLKTLRNVLNRDPNQQLGLKTGFISIDRIIDNFIDGLFYVIGARPGAGKTAFMVQLVENLTRQHYILTANGKLLIKPKPVGIIELETHDEAFVHRQLANISQVNSRNMKTGNLTDEQKESIHAAANDLISKGIIADFNPTSTITQVRIKAKAWKKKHDIGILFIDYLQYMDVDPESYRMPRERQVALMSKGLAGLAKEISIPIVAFAQLSREVYKRADKRPQMSDLRESGAIEMDARCIMFLHRPEYYGELVDSETGMSLAGVTEVIIAKNNDGDMGVAKLKFIKELSKFVELDAIDTLPFQPIYVIPGTKDAPEFDDETPF